MVAGGLLWLFIAAAPALADGGPHLSLVNSGSSTLTADSCAGCHRAHTAQGEFLLAADSEEALCLSCHGNAGTLATTNVEIGIQYVPGFAGVRPNTATAVNIVSSNLSGVITTSVPHHFVVGQSVTISTGVSGVAAGPFSIATAPSATTFTLLAAAPGTATYVLPFPTATGTATPVDNVVLGALRDGGFVQARIDSSNPSRLAYIRGYENGPVNTEFAISAKPKVGVLGASEPVNSAHIDLTPSPLDGIADTGTVWGKGVGVQLGTPLVTITCVECHNPHGNGQYRILRPVPGIEADPLGQPLPVAIKATYDNFDTIVTNAQHALVVGDMVTISGVTGFTDGTYFVAVVTNGFTFKVAASLLTLGTVVSVPNTTLVGSVLRSEVPIADVNPYPDAPGVTVTKNYTVLQTKGSQGVDSTYLLYARDVLAARGGTGVATNQPAVSITTVISSGTPAVFYFQTGTTAHGLAVGDLVTIAGNPGGVADGATYTVGAVRSSGTVYNQFSVVGLSPPTGATTGTVARNGIPGVYTSTGGDYFRRLVPWNTSILNPSCSNTTFSTANSAYCGTANDAPNGRPSAFASTSAGNPSSLLGQQAFLDQMSTWCSQCHTRYYSASNENDGTHPIISSQADFPIAGTAATDIIQSDNLTPATATSGRYGGPSYGDRVTFTGTGTDLDTTAPVGGWWVIYTGTSSTFQVSLTKDGAAFNILADFNPGTFTKVYQSSNSSWGYPRDDATYKYQHSTASNRGCTVCHVAHGSNAEMNDANGTTFSLNVPYPDGTTVSTSSRLLKVDNRGTCQMCHDPTGTILAGDYLPNPGYATTVP
jgi:predicted CXXCH cytochrome family protein